VLSIHLAVASSFLFSLQPQSPLSSPKLLFCLIPQEANSTPRSCTTAALALGSLYLLTTLLSIPAVLQPPSRTSLLAWLSTALFINFICTMVLSSKLWFFSLRQVVNFEEIFRSLDEAARSRLETKVSLLPVL
jgi:hypothetical protein